MGCKRIVAYQSLCGPRLFLASGLEFSNVNTMDIKSGSTLIMAVICHFVMSILVVFRCVFMELNLCSKMWTKYFYVITMNGLIYFLYSFQIYNLSHLDLKYTLV